MGVPAVYFLVREGISSWKKFGIRSTENRLLLAFVILLLALSFSGILLAEVGRILVFLMPIPIALLIVYLSRGERSWGLEICFCLQIAQLIVIKLAWNPIRLEPGLVDLFEAL